jgi:hypothetical protein
LGEKKSDSQVPIVRIRLVDIDLDGGNIYIRATIKTTARALTLMLDQVMPESGEGI